MFCFRFRVVLLIHFLKKLHMALICEQSVIYDTNKAIINILLNIAGSSKRLSYMCFLMCSHLSKILFAVYRQKANCSCKSLFEVQASLMVFHDSMTCLGVKPLPEFILGCQFSFCCITLFSALWLKWCILFFWQYFQWRENHIRDGHVAWGQLKFGSTPPLISDRSHQ